MNHDARFAVFGNRLNTSFIANKEARSLVPSANITTLSIKVNIFAFAKIMSGTNCLGNSWKIWFDKVYDTKARAFQAAYSILPAASVIQNKGTLLWSQQKLNAKTWINKTHWKYWYGIVSQLVWGGRLSRARLIRVDVWDFRLDMSYFPAKTR